jgi:hypothetical protein
VAQIDDPLNSRHYNHVWELLKRYLMTPTDPISSISGSQTEDAATTTESTPLALFFRSGLWRGTDTEREWRVSGALSHTLGRVQLERAFFLINTLWSLNPGRVLRR